MRLASTPRWMPAALLAALGVAPATGCSFDHAGVDMTIDAAGGDDSPDAPPAPDATDVPDAAPPDAACGGMALTFTPANVDACAIPPSQGDFTFPDAKVTIDTTAGTVRTPGGPLAVAHAIVTQTDGATEAMVISADDLTVPAGVDVVVTGSRPLIVVALGTMDVAGTLDAGGTMGVAGPGGDLACATGAGAAGVTQVDADGHTGATGGSGGARGTDGGGGAYVSPVTNNPQMITGGQAWGVLTATALSGGCSGGAGGVVAGTAAVAGGGGGGLEVVGGVAVQIHGTVTVSGGGGDGAATEGGGGGGGGSGGALLIQAPNLAVAGGILTANGGAGGEGRRNTQPGTRGDDGSRTTDVEATGGSGAAGGNGGLGAVGNGDGGDGEAGTGDSMHTAGGGGGGGAVGRIHFRVGSVSYDHELVSPQATSSSL